MHAEDLPYLNCRIKIDNFYVDLSEKIYIKPSLRQKTPIKEETLAQVSPYKFQDIFKNTFFTKYL